MYKRLFTSLTICALVSANAFAATSVINIGRDDVAADCTPAVLTALGNHTSGTVTITANFEPNHYNVTYAPGAHADMGAVEYTDPTDAIYDASYNVLVLANTGITPAPGYVFDKWKYEDTNTEYAAGSVINPYKYASDITLTAQWVPIQCNITYELSSNDAQFAPGANVPYTYSVVDSDIVLPTPIRDGFKFIGWYESDDLSGNAVDKIPAGSLCDGGKTFYAKWEFKCDPEHWFHVGDDHICMYETKQTTPTIKVNVNGNDRYLMLSDNPNLPMNQDANGRKMRVQYNGTPYNVHDKSVLQ